MSDIGKWDARAFYDKLGPRKPVRNVHLKSFKVSKHGDQLRILVRTTGEDADIRVIMDRKFRFVFADVGTLVTGHHANSDPAMCPAMLRRPLCGSGHGCAIRVKPLL